MKMNNAAALAALMGLLLSTAGCADSTEANGDAGEAAATQAASRASQDSTESPARLTEAQRQERLEARMRRQRQLPQAIPRPEPGQVVGEVPEELLDAVMSDLAGRGKGTAADIQVLRGEHVVWPDGSLGCPKPDQVYTQALVKGYWIILLYGGKKYDYRATENGTFFLCEGLNVNRLYPKNPLARPATE